MSTRNCTGCGAAIGQLASRCPFCEAEQAASEALGDSAAQMRILVNNLEKQLKDAKNRSDGPVMWVLLLCSIAVIAGYLTMDRMGFDGLTRLTVTFVMALTTMMVFGSYISIAERRAQSDFFASSVEPAIATFMAHHKMNRQSFDIAAAQMVSKHAVLKRFLFRPPAGSE